MKISLAATDPTKLKTDLLALACDDQSLEDDATIDAVDRSLGGALKRAAKEERFRGKPGQTLTLHTLERLPATRVALLGVGPRKGIGPAQLRDFAARASRLGNVTGSSSLALLLALTPPAGAPERLAEGAMLGAYRFDKYLSEEKRTPRALNEVTILVGGDESSHDAITRGVRLATAVCHARDLVNEPAGHLTPTRLAEVAREFASASGLEVQILDREACRRLGMGLYLAVSQGSVEEPRFIHLAWKPPGAKKRVVLVGKGVTFDSGGLSLKPNDGMLDMKTDMAGAAAVVSVMPLLAQENVPVEVHALAACTENMPSGSSYKLGDVLRSKAGKTVEINNTDAEGRLTLADALSYGLDLKPDAVFDFATLTGACVVALGPHTAGVMSNDETLASAWLDAARSAGEEMWRLPLPDRLIDQLKSEIADMKNTGERWGGALTAGLFLKEFVGNTPWVHVDLAGPSSADKENGAVSKGGTGFAVATIFEYLRRLGA